MNTHKEEPKFKERDWVVAIDDWDKGKIGWVREYSESSNGIHGYMVVFENDIVELATWKEEKNLELLAPLEPKEKEVQFKGWESTDAVARYGDLPEPTPPSQIEEAVKSSFEQGYELGLEHGRELALKDVELLGLEKQLEAINKLTKE